MNPLINHPCMWTASGSANAHEYSVHPDDDARTCLLAAARTDAAVTSGATARPLVEAVGRNQATSYATAAGSS